MATDPITWVSQREDPHDRGPAKGSWCAPDRRPSALAARSLRHHRIWDPSEPPRPPSYHLTRLSPLLQVCATLPVERTRPSGSRFGVGARSCRILRCLIVEPSPGWRTGGPRCSYLLTRVGGPALRGEQYPSPEVLLRHPCRPMQDLCRQAWGEDSGTLRAAGSQGATRAFASVPACLLSAGTLDVSAGMFVVCVVSVVRWGIGVWGGSLPPIDVGRAPCSLPCGRPFRPGRSRGGALIEGGAPYVPNARVKCASLIANLFCVSCVSIIKCQMRACGYLVRRNNSVLSGSHIRLFDDVRAQPSDRFPRVKSIERK